MPSVHLYEVDGNHLAVIDGQLYVRAMQLQSVPQSPHPAPAKLPSASSILDMVKPNRVTNRRKVDEETRQAILRDIEAGLKTAEIARRHDVPLHTVVNTRARAKLAVPANLPVPSAEAIS